MRRYARAGEPKATPAREFDISQEPLYQDFKVGPGAMHSLHNQLLNLPNELEVFPWHQAGSACGADTRASHCQ